MRSPRDTVARLRLRLSGRRLPIWHHSAWRVAANPSQMVGVMEPRRADLALWALQSIGLARQLDLRTPTVVGWEALGRVHTADWLEAITRPRDLSHVFGLDDPDFPVDPVLTAVRLAAGATLSALQEAAQTGETHLVLHGGMHHAAPDRGTGFCPINDVAIAIAALRAAGDHRRLLVLDLDAHPPDGTAACVGGDPPADARVAVASISGSEWAAPPGVDEIALPPGSGDDAYAAALATLLGRTVRPELAIVLAGGDVRAGDPFGRLALSEAGVRERDRTVRRWLADIPAVWLAAGGYRPDAWRVLAHTGLTLLHPDLDPLPPDLDPLSTHFLWVSSSLGPADLGMSSELTDEDVAAMFGGPTTSSRYLGTYSQSGVELALARYGVLPALTGLGYTDITVTFDRAALGERLQVTGTARGERHLLVESVLAVETHADRRWLVVHWLTLRHPIGHLPPGRHLLPGQEVPGPGLGPEAVLILRRMAARLHLAGLLFRPAHLHVALQSIALFHFLDPTEQGRFDALIRDLGHLGMAALTDAVSAGRVLMNGLPWTWPAAPMVDRDVEIPSEAQEVEARRVHFELAPTA